MNYKNILVAIDGSEPAEKAFHQAVEIAKRNNARLILAHVIDNRRVGRVEAFSPNYFQDLQEKMREMLEEYKEKAEQAGIADVEISLEVGSPKVEVGKKIAPEYEADLIVCGSSGLSALQRWMLGSVSEGIARCARCDVLIVKGEDVEEEKEED